MSEPLHTRVCSFELDPRGFVRATIHEGAEMDLQDAQEAVQAMGRLTGGRCAPVLVDSRGVRYQTKPAREHFVSEEAARVSAAVALLVGSPVSRMVGNFFLRSGQHRFPTRLFTEEAAAIAWLASLAP